MSKLRTQLKKASPDSHKLDLEKLHGILRDYIFGLSQCTTPEELRKELQRLRHDLTNPIDDINDFERNQHRP